MVGKKVRAAVPNLEGRPSLSDVISAGLISQELAPYCKTIVGVDSNEEAVAAYNQTVDNHGIPADEMRAVLLDADGAIPSTESPFDVIVVSLCSNRHK